jgi:hypothetical protein
MEAPRRYSVSPYYSFVTVPTRRQPSFIDAFRQIVRWAINRQPKPSESEEQLRAFSLSAALATVAAQTERPPHGGPSDVE